MEKTHFETSTNSGEVRLQNKLFYEFYEHLKFISKTFTEIEFQIMEKNYSKIRARYTSKNKLFYEFYEHLKYIIKTFTEIEF